MRNLPRHIWLAPRKAFVLLISAYQATLSPDHGPFKGLHPYGFCRHEPTCSEYGKQAVARRGVVIGGALILRRLLSCHPWKRPSEKRILSVLGR